LPGDKKRVQILEISGIKVDTPFFIIDKKLAAYQTAETLESSLENQKGFVSYYILDGDSVWLEKLEKYLQTFSEQLNPSL
jgi:hypothetical protein